MQNDITWQPGMTLEDIERLVILRAIKYYKHNKSQTARALGIGIRTLDSKLERYGEPVQVSKMKTDEMKRKIKTGLLHFFGDRSKVALQLGISVSKLEEYVNEIAREEASRGLGMEPFIEVSPQPTLPVPKWQEVQSVLPVENSSSHPGGLSQGAQDAHADPGLRAKNNPNSGQETDGCNGLASSSKSSAKQRGSAVGNQNPRAN
jgi:hypothetical protein